MGKKYTFLTLILLGIGALGLAVWFLLTGDVAVLSPKGTIAAEQRNLIVIATLLMLLVVVPVFILTFTIAWKYRASNTKAKYSPDWDHNIKLETLWWGLPFAIIAIISVLIWKSSHSLDPFRPLDSTTKPVTIQVVALQWKWLFIYPEYNIATVNYVQFPEDTPVNFEITADAPMNSFWIPQLGSQVYAMAGMKTKLHLMANDPGSYNGSSANLSGEGFAGMQFIATSTTQTDFNQWVQMVKQSKDVLSHDEYDKLAIPSQNEPPIHYGFSDSSLYDTVIMKYMAPGQQQNEGHGH